MMITLPIILAALCVPNTAAWTPTPVLQVEHTLERTTGMMVYWRERGDASWLPCAALSVQYDDEARPFHPLVTMGYPVQRCVPDEMQGHMIEFAVTAVSANDESAMSNIIELCMPLIVQREGK